MNMRPFCWHFTAIFCLCVNNLAAASPPGTVVGWGDNTVGCVTTIPTRNPPDQANFAVGYPLINGRHITNAISIAAGEGHSLALLDTGVVVGWGGNFFGEALGHRTGTDPTNGVIEIGGRILNNAVKIAVGRTYSLALEGDGTVVAWGDNESGQTTVPAGLSDVVGIDGSMERSLALKKDGTVDGWGKARPPKELANIIAIATAKYLGRNDYAITASGEVVEWSNVERSNPPRAIPGLTNIVAISGGWSHSLALTRDGTVIGWGSNQYGETTGLPSTNFQDRFIGTVVLGGQVLSNVTAIAAGMNFSLALKKDGQVVQWGKKFVLGSQAEPPPGLSGVVAIAAGEMFALAITTNSPALPNK